jgi:hypothetical protein
LESPSANLAYLLPKLPRKALPAHPDHRQILAVEANLAPAKFAGNRRICQGQGAGKIALSAGVLHGAQGKGLNFSQLGAPRPKLANLDRPKSAHTY